MARKKGFQFTKKHGYIAGAMGVVILIVLIVGLIRLGPFAAEEEGPQEFIFDEENSIVYYPYFSLFSEEVTMGDVVLAKRYTETSLIANSTFEQNTTMYFILANATGFEAQQDGYSWYDVDLELVRADGTVVYTGENILGEKGKLYLKSSVVTPYGTIEVPMEAQPGDYTLKIRLFDVNTEESVNREAMFTVTGEELVLEEMPEPVFEMDPENTEEPLLEEEL